MPTLQDTGDRARSGDLAPQTREAWRLVRTMLDDMTRTIEQDAETELELIEGLRALARITALCSELSVDVDHEHPFFFDMNGPMRLVGGPNPDGAYHLAMIDGRRRYRIRGRRGTSAYLGFQVLAGRGLTPRRMAAYVSDHDLPVLPDGDFELVLARREPSPAELQAATWVEIPDDASGIVVRQYVGDAHHEELATYTIEPLDRPAPPALPADAQVAEQLTAMAWTIAKLATLHRTIRPDLLQTPNEISTTAAANLGGENTTPDNLYAIGSFRLGPDEALVIDATPPESRYWNVALENVWHECFDARRRRISVTSVGAVRRPDGGVRIVVAARDPGIPTANWLDTGGRHRGFVTFRWLDHPEPPAVTTRVVPVDEVVHLA